MLRTPFDEGERRAWAGSAAAYEAGFGRLCAYPVPQLLDAAGVAAGVRVLDVGTGTGSAAAAAGARGARVVAVDAEPDMARHAARAVPDASVHVAALPQLPYADGQFDAVVGNFVLNHVGRPRVALDELRRVTRPGGRIALTLWAAPAAPGQALLGRAVQAAGVSRPPSLPALAPEDDFPRTEDGLVGLLRGAGLTDAVCRIAVLGPPHHPAGVVERSGGGGGDRRPDRTQPGGGRGRAHPAAIHRVEPRSSPTLKAGWCCRTRRCWRPGGWPGPACRPVVARGFRELGHDHRQADRRGGGGAQPCGAGVAVGVPVTVAVVCGSEVRKASSAALNAFGRSRFGI